MSKWETIALGDFISLRRGHDLPYDERRPGRIPVVGSGGPAGFHDTAVVAGPGITIGRAANLGIPTYIQEDFWPLNTTLYVTDFHGNDIRFAYYLLRTLDLAGFNSGSVQPMLNRNYIRDFPIQVPSVREQQAVTAVLGGIDDKIAVNDRIARSARDLALLCFHEAIELSVGDDVELSAVAESVTRGVAPRYTEDESQLRVLNQKCVRDGHVNLGPSRWTLADKVSAVKLLQVNDVLVNSTGVGTLGRVARWTRHDACTVDSHISIVRFDTAKIDPVCAGFAILEAESEIEALGEGSTGQTELSRARLSALKIAVPSGEQALELRPKLDALETRCDSAFKESAALAELRDSLLPKLMSGVIRVRDAEKVVEDVT